MLLSEDDLRRRRWQEGRQRSRALKYVKRADIQGTARSGLSTIFRAKVQSPARNMLPHLGMEGRKGMGGGLVSSESTRK